jgi:predicted nuclease of predicted toxin-antitoxin system
VRFLIDNQLPAALARFFAASGFEASHVRDLGLDKADDQTIWSYAKTHDCTVVSKDEDFLYLATLHHDGPPLVWVRLGNCRKGALLDAFEGILPHLLVAMRSGQRIIEVR